MNIALASPRLIRLPNDELIEMAVDEGYDSLAYALACRLQHHLERDESEAVTALNSEVAILDTKVWELEQYIEESAREKNTLEGKLAKYEEGE